MKFEKNPTDDHEHGIVLEAAQAEVEPVAAAYREHVFLVAKSGRVDELRQYQRDFSEWDSSSDHTIFTNHPLAIAELLERFHAFTIEAVGEIVKSESEPAFDSDAVARRMRLGDKAIMLSELIKAEFATDSFHQKLDEQWSSMASPTETPQQPPDS